MYSPKFYVGFLSYKLYNYIAYIAEIILRRITVTPKSLGQLRPGNGQRSDQFRGH